MFSNKTTIIIVIFSIICFSCTHKKHTSKSKMPECLPSDYYGFVMEWGYINNKNNITTGYSLEDNGYILMFIQDGNEKKYDTVSKISSDRICNILKLYIDEVLKISVVNEPGDELTFIKLNKPANNFRSTAIWNKFNTRASEGYRRVFDTLMSNVTVHQ
ncbi:MAG: hypothetical protein FWG85_04320 [Bacteroidetes bacterium]|nr:hypothetical protein [Bacteroidota bacterium]